MKQLLWQIPFLFIFHLCFSQNAVQELKKINKAYLSAENLSMDVSVMYYKDKNDKAGKLMGQGLMKRSGSNYYSHFAENEMLSNHKVTLIIDHSEKSITCLQSEKKKGKQNMSKMPNLDSLITLNDSVVLKGVQDNVQHLCVYSRASYIRQTDIYFDKTTSLIKKIIYYYSDSNEDESYDIDKAVVEYKNIQLSKIDDSIFSERKYISFEHGKPVVTDGYKKYKLITSENEEL